MNDVITSIFINKQYYISISIMYLITNVKIII
jgi:hypothetical protein